MDLKRIEELLEKYLDARTSVAEEAELRDYFASDQVALHLVEYQSMFGYFNQAKETHYEGQIMVSNRNPSKRHVMAWAGIAVSILFLAGLFLNQPSKAGEFGTYDDPEIALERTKEALNFLSENLKAGNQELGHLQEFNHAKNELIKSNKRVE